MASRTYIGYCHRCKALGEFSDDRQCPRLSNENYPSTRCKGRLSLLWGNHEVAKAVLAAYQIGGWTAAIAVWEEAGRPELAYDDSRSRDSRHDR